MEFEVVEEDLGEIQWEDGIFNPSKYIDHWRIGMWEKVFNTIIKETNPFIKFCNLFQFTRGEVAFKPVL